MHRERCVRRGAELPRSPWVHRSPSTFMCHQPGSFPNLYFGEFYGGFTAHVWPVINFISSPSWENGKWSWKFQTSNHVLVFLVTIFCHPWSFKGFRSSVPGTMGRHTYTCILLFLMLFLMWLMRNPGVSCACQAAFSGWFLLMVLLACLNTGCPLHAQQRLPLDPLFNANTACSLYSFPHPGIRVVHLD